jgi:succinate dehydrogenase/fumarate reductase cytochrome b subunit
MYSIFISFYAFSFVLSSVFWFFELRSKREIYGFVSSENIFWAVLVAITPVANFVFFCILGISFFVEKIGTTKIWHTVSNYKFFEKK